MILLIEEDRIPMEEAIKIDDSIKLAGQVKNGASWFYWIAGLSIINTIIVIIGQDLNFVIGLGITQIIDEFGKNGTINKALQIGLDIVITGIVALFGYFGNKGKSWSFIAGIVLYTLDGLLFLIGMALLPLGFHVFALFFIVRGFLANRKLNKMGTQGNA